MYNDDDLFIIDEFLSIDYIAAGLKHLVSPKLLIHAVRDLQAYARNKDSDPVEVMKRLQKVSDAVGPFLFKNLLASEVFEDWCPTHQEEDVPVPVDDGICCWSGTKGSVFTRQTDNERDTPLVMHAIYSTEAK